MYIDYWTKKKISLILLFINQKYPFSFGYTKMMWKQNHASSVPQIRGVNAYFQLEFITWSYSRRGLKEHIRLESNFKCVV